jgi:hypothetical protein
MFPFIAAASFAGPDRIPGERPTDQEHRKDNYELCRAIDLTKLGAHLEDMVKRGRMDRQLAEIFHIQASALRAAILSENNRAHER